MSDRNIRLSRTRQTFVYKHGQAREYQRGCLSVASLEIPLVQMESSNRLKCQEVLRRLSHQVFVERSGPNPRTFCSSRCDQIRWNDERGIAFKLVSDSSVRQCRPTPLLYPRLFISTTRELALLEACSFFCFPPLSPFFPFSYFLLFFFRFYDSVHRVGRLSG